MKTSRTRYILLSYATLAYLMYAQPGDRTIPAGTMLQVRTNQTIDSSSAAPGQVFTGLVAHDVTNQRGRVVIPGGSSAELVVRRVSKHQIALDLQAIMIADRRY